MSANDAKRSGSSSPPSRVRGNRKAGKRAQSPQGPPPPIPDEMSEDLAEAYLLANGPMRHLLRIMQQVLLEIRTARQYTQFLHEMLAKHEMGGRAGLLPPEEMKQRAAAALRKAEAERKKQFQEADKKWLAARRARGIGNGGLDLTPEERAAFERGEVPPGFEEEG